MSGNSRGKFIGWGLHGTPYQVELPDDPEHVARYVQVQDASTPPVFLARAPHHPDGGGSSRLDLRRDCRGVSPRRKPEQRSTVLAPPRLWERGLGAEAGGKRICPSYRPGKVARVKDTRVTLGGVWPYSLLLSQHARQSAQSAVYTRWGRLRLWVARRCGVCFSGRLPRAPG